MTLNATHLTINLLRTLVHNLDDLMEVSYNTPEFTAAKSYIINFCLESAVSHLTLGCPLSIATEVPFWESTTLDLTRVQSKKIITGIGLK